LEQSFIKKKKGRGAGNPKKNGSASQGEKSGGLSLLGGKKGNGVSSVESGKGLRLRVPENSVRTRQKGRAHSGSPRKKRPVAPGRNRLYCLDLGGRKERADRSISCGREGGVRHFGTALRLMQLREGGNEGKCCGSEGEWSSFG